ncbi:membrane integrity-associated transporter subunit PqiC [Alcaligenaceae bacterium]|nr:membrane integrity-associated transporter subunit PqiC [Alcaligenaceae bacterium]
MNQPPRFWRTTLAVGMLGLASACSVLPEAQIKDSYRLPLASFPAQAAQSVQIPSSLQVATPHGGHLLEGRRLLVIRPDNQINAYKGVQWSEPPPVLMQHRILDAFRADGRIKSISNDAASVQSDIELHSDLRGFHVEYHGKRPFVRVQLDTSLVTTAARRIIATRSFAVELPAKSVQIPDIIEAFGAATDQLALEIVEWAVTSAATATR